MRKVKGIQIPELSLYFLISSFFICIPFGRYQAFGMATDFRLYDFMGLIFILINHKRLSLFYKLVRGDKKWFLYYSRLLVFIIFISIWVAVLYSGPSIFPPLVIRFYRFALYFMSAFFAVSIVTNHLIFKRILHVFYVNIAIQAILAFMQGLDVIGSFWPDYWIHNYGSKNFAVGMLSPHHKQIAVVMLMGISLSLAYVRTCRSFIKKALYTSLLMVMVAVPLFEGTKTFLFSLIGMALAFLYINKLSSVPIIILMSFFFLIGVNAMPESGKSSIESIMEERVGRWAEEGNVSKLMTGRDKIYIASFNSILRHPYLLVTGSGFQNINKFIYATGAHNNYLHYLMETGLIGLIVFMSFLKRIWKNLIGVYTSYKGTFIGESAKFGWIAFVGILFSLFTGEVLYAQYSMFTLAGQIIMFFGILISPLFWKVFQLKQFHAH